MSAEQSLPVNKLLKDDYNEVEMLETLIVIMFALVPLDRKADLLSALVQNIDHQIAEA